MERVARHLFDADEARRSLESQFYSVTAWDKTRELTREDFRNRANSALAEQCLLGVLAQLQEAIDYCHETTACRAAVKVAMVIRGIEKYFHPPLDA